MSYYFRCGVGKAAITPAVGTILYGYAPGRPAESIHDDLFVTAFAFSDGEKTLLAVTSDVCEFGIPESERLRNAISEATSVPHDRIVYTAIHTHSAPCVMDAPGWGGVNEEYFSKIMIPSSVKAACDAIYSMKDALMGIGTVESEVGINRREMMPDGSIRLGQSEWSPMDKEMTVLSFRTPDGKPIGSIVHYGAHCTAAGCNPEVTRDWAGVMVDRLEKETGGIVGFFNGAFGDTGPRLTNGLTVGNLQYALELGGKAAFDAVRAYHRTSGYFQPELKILTDEIKIPCAPAFTKEELEKRIAAMGDPEKLFGEGVMEYTKYKRLLDRIEKGLPAETEHAFSQTLFALGCVAFVPFGYEVFSEITLLLKKYSPFAHTLSLGCANGTNFYLPTQDQLCRGGYEVEMFHIGTLFTLCDNADIRFVQQNLGLLGKLNSEE